MSNEPWFIMIGVISFLGMLITPFFEIKIVEKEKSPAGTEDFRD